MKDGYMLMQRAVEKVYKEGGIMANRPLRVNIMNYKRVKSKNQVLCFILRIKHVLKGK